MSNSKRYAYELCDKCRDSYPLPIPYMDWEQEDKEIKELLGKSDQSGIPINSKEVGMRALKLLLLELCIREAKWVGKHPNSLKLQRVPIEEFEQTFDYGLKDITKLDDFNQVVDWENSSFYQATNQSSSVIS